VRLFNLIRNLAAGIDGILRPLPIMPPGTGGATPSQQSESVT
jgi:hypothetical protein